MEKKEPMIEEMIRKQMEKWEKRTSGESEEKPPVSVITVSVDPGSGGKRIARGIARELHFDLFDRAIIEAIAESTHKSTQVIETLEKERLSGIEDFIASIINRDYLYRRRLQDQDRS